LAKLLLVRHGRTRLYQSDRFWGSTDIPLSDLGIKQAELLRDRLASEKITAVYSSGLSRTKVAAEIIAAPHRKKVTAVPELNECNFGYVEGLTFGEIQQQYPDLAEVLLGFDIDTQFPGGESFSELDDRVRKFLPVLEEYTVKDTVLIVGHGGTLPLFVCRLLGIPIKLWRQFRITQGSLSIIEMYREGSYLTLLNDTSHLAE